jgi:DNA-binding IclR family transcriptional regulator
VSAPTFRFNERLDEAARRVMEAAEMLSAAIGGRSDPAT